MNLEHFDTILSFVMILTGVSLLVTTLTQMASALLGLRGSNLRWGLETLLAHTDPNLAPHAREISEKVLHHSLISDSTLSGFNMWLIGRWKLASAIRQDELIEILHMLVKPSAPPVAGVAPEPWAAALKQSLEQLDRTGVERLLQAAPEIKRALPDDPAQAEQIIEQLTASAEKLSGNIEQWFDSVMDRVAQRFVMHTRIWTIVFSVVIAFALHLDAFKLLTRLSSDAELRARLVNSADALTRKADEILATSTNGSSATYIVAMRQLISAHTNELKALPPPAGFATLDGGKQWLSNELKAAHLDDTEKWAQSYEEMVPQAALRSAADNFQFLLNDKLKFALVPDPYPKPFYNYWTPTWLHFWGIAASAALLSLGAPFWFNMLKTLSNLRPVVAKKQQAESESETDA